MYQSKEKLLILGRRLLLGFVFAFIEIGFLSSFFPVIHYYKPILILAAIVFVLGFFYLELTALYKRLFK